MDLTEDRPADVRKSAILAIIPRIIRSMQSIRDLTLKGYYYDASVLERSLIESMGLCAYLAFNEKEAENWTKGNDVKTPKIKLFDWAFKLLRVKDKDADSYRIYGELCGYVHTSAKAITSLMKFNHGRGLVDLQFISNFEKERVHEIASYPTLMLIIVKEIFHDELAGKRKENIMKWVKEYLRKK